MIRNAIVCVLLILASGQSIAADITVIENPSPQTSFVEASVKLAEGQSVTWVITPEPTKTVEVNETVYFNGPAGKYRVAALVFSVENGKVKTKKYVTSIVIGDPPPPIPPPPIPPSDQFTKDLQTAFAAETEPDKAVSAAKLASLYKVSSEKTVFDPNITTFGQLFDTMLIARRAMVPDGKLPKVHQVYGARLNALFGAAATKLDTATRQKLSTELKAVADSLNTLK
jgi:hypothetical protein